MTSNNDPSSKRNGQDAPGASEAAGSTQGGTRRPHATLELKAVEIKPRQTSASAESSSQDSGDKSKTRALETAATGATKTASEKSMEDKKSDSEIGSAATSNRSDVGKGDKGKTGGDNAPPPAAVKRRGGFFSHLLAAVIGGTVALFGGDWALNELGVPIPYRASMQGMDSLESRLSQMEEQIANTPLSGSGGEVLTDGAQQQVAVKLQAMSETVAGLRQQQETIQETLEVLREQSGTVLADADLSTRIAGLEEQISTRSEAAASGGDSGPIPQLAALTSKLGELEQRMAQAAANPAAAIDETMKSRMTEAEAAAVAAKLDTQRLNKDLAALKTNATRLDERVETLKSQADRIEENLKELNEADTKAAAEFVELKRELTTELGSVARPDDINQAVTPFTTRIVELEKQLQRLEKLEAKSRENARKVVASLELASLKRTLDSGEPFAEQLAKMQTIAGEAKELAGLQKFASSGVPTIEDLQTRFTDLIPDMIGAARGEDDSSFLERFVNQAKSVVRVRKVNVDPNDNSAEAVIARMESALKSGDLGMVLKEGEKLEDAPKAVAASWLDQVRARQAVDGAIANLEQDIKNALSQGSTTAP